MKRILALVGTCTVLVATLAVASGATASSAKFTPCTNTRYAPQYLTIKHVFERGTNCTVAHGVAQSYMNAVTESFGRNGSRTGQCFGEHSYGRCPGVRFQHLAYTCFHYGPVPKQTRGLVRCDHADRRVSFNIGS